MRATALKLAALLIAVPTAYAEDKPKPVEDKPTIEKSKETKPVDPNFAEKGIPAKPDAMFSTEAFPCIALSYKMASYAKNSENKEIAEFAKKIDKDHSDAADRFSKALKESKLAVVSGTEKGFQEKLDNLAKKKGSEQDRAFLEELIAGHKKSMPLFEAQAVRGETESLKKFAADVLPVMKGHMEEAKKLLDAQK